MGDPVTDQVSWSIRLPHGAMGQRRFEEQLDLVRRLLVQQFPASSGYQIDGLRLGGPIDGVRWSVVRGPFRAELGVQRFVRAHSGPAPVHHELRIVANAGLGDPRALDSEQLERRVVGGAIASWCIATMSAGALWIATQGLLVGWGQLLLVLPAAMTWRAAMTMIARRADRPALPAAAASGDAALPASEQHDGLRRWRELVPVLEAQRERLESITDRPFRNPGRLDVAAEADATPRPSRRPDVSPGCS